MSQREDEPFWQSPRLSLWLASGVYPCRGKTLIAYMTSCSSPWRGRATVKRPIAWLRDGIRAW